MSKSGSSQRDHKSITTSSYDTPSAPSTPNLTGHIGRPPPLDAATERALQRACAIVVQDLKPSAYDIEDTRMKSDMLLDEEDREGKNYNRPAAKARRPALKSHGSSGTKQKVSWLKSDNESPALNPPDVVVEHHDSTSAARQPFIAQQRDDSAAYTLNHSVKPQPLDSNASYETRRLPKQDGPLAPLPTHATESRQDVSIPPVQTTQSSGPPRLPSFNSDASSPYSPSMSGPNSASTAISSAPFTPSHYSSKRESDGVYSKQASAADGQWMKQGVERHLQQKEAPRASNARVEPAKAPAPKTVSKSSGDDPYDAGRDSMTWPESRRPHQPRQMTFLEALAAENPNREPHPLVTGPPRRMTFLEALAAEDPNRKPHPLVTGPPRPQPVRTASGVSTSSNKVQRPTSSTRSTSSGRLSGDLQRDSPRAQSVNLINEPLPPLPRMNDYQKHELPTSAGSGSSYGPHTASTSRFSQRYDDRRPSQPLEQQVQAGMNQREDVASVDGSSINFGEFRMTSAVPYDGSSYQQAPVVSDERRSSHDIASAPRHPPNINPLSHHPINSSASSSWPMTQPAPSQVTQTTQANQRSPRIAHQEDDSVVVKDFWKPPQQTGMTTNNVSSSRTSRVQDVRRSPDPTAADFDYLMSYIDVNPKALELRDVKMANTSQPRSGGKMSPPPRHSDHTIMTSAMQRINNGDRPNEATQSFTSATPQYTTSQNPQYQGTKSLTMATQPYNAAPMRHSTITTSRSPDARPMSQPMYTQIHMSNGDRNSMPPQPTASNLPSVPQQDHVQKARKPKQHYIQYYEQQPYEAAPPPMSAGSHTSSAQRAAQTNEPATNGIKQPPKQRRGVAKLLHKLGGGDPHASQSQHSRRKASIASVKSTNSHSGYVNRGRGWEEEDSEDDACAAPVVGFGRGW
ncbi:MAG: hypothetical protein M1828_004147 [Chrysothrix sp. TS-e1954]|nr:MAG: hypothetical protein M1828_004147 [Chrysothrix sp. TS-e1954]